MSEEATPGQEGFSSALDDFAAFTAVMDTLVPEEDNEETEQGDTQVSPDAGGTGRTAAADEAPGREGTTADASGDGAAGDPGVPDPADSTTPAGTDGDDRSGAAGVGADFTAIQPEFGKISTAIEESTLKLHQSSALTESEAEYTNYFDAIRQHPRMLVGQEVPSATGEGTEVLRDSQDAKDWQDAIKKLLAGDIQERVERKMEEDAPMLQTLHSSIELFQNNSDLVPGTKQFDRELADRLMTLAKPYQVRTDGKLTGFSIPVQPLVEQVRSDLKVQRAQQKQAQPPAQPKQPAPQKRQQAPQAGIRSKAGESAEQAEDFSALFGTIGLPTLRI